MLSYWFYPNPGGTGYGNPKVLVLIALCLLLFLASFVVSAWRKSRTNPVTRKLSRSWSRALRWFGGIGLILVIARAEGIQFFSMRILWAVWVLVCVAFIGLQMWLFRRKHYEVVPREKVDDPREKYLPAKGK